MLEIGQTASISKVASEDEIHLMGSISCDFNPIHFDENFAKESIFGKRILHGIWGAGLISGVIGTKLPGPGSIYLEQHLKFIKPVFLDDTIKATVTVKKIEKKIVELETKCYNQDGEIVIEGFAIVLPPISTYK